MYLWQPKRVAQKGKQTPLKKREVKNTQGKRQALSVILFGISLFLLAVVIIPGENIWQNVHDFLFGLFGWITFAVPIFLVAISFLYASQKLQGKALAKMVQIAILLLLIGAAIDIFLPNIDGATFGEHITAAYHSGVEITQTSGWSYTFNVGDRVRLEAISRSGHVFSGDWIINGSIVKKGDVIDFTSITTNDAGNYAPLYE